MVDLRRVLIGAMMVGQLLLGLGSDLAHRCVDPSCAPGCGEIACGDPHGSHRHDDGSRGHVHGLHRHGTASDCSSHHHDAPVLSASSDRDASAGASASESRRKRPDAGWASVHDADGCALCRQLTRPAFETPMPIGLSGIDRTVARIVEPQGRRAIHRSLGHDGRGPPADLL